MREMKLLIHSQTSTIAPLKFGNHRNIISSHTLSWLYYLSMLGLNLIHVNKRGHRRHFQERKLNTLQRHGRHDVLIQWLFDCLFNSLFGLTSQKSSNVHIVCPLWGESSGDGFPSQRANNAASVFMSWRHDVWQPFYWDYRYPCQVRTTYLKIGYQ